MDPCFRAFPVYIYVYIAGTVWETMQEGLHAASLFGPACLCGIQQGTVGEAGVLKKTGTSEGVRTWVHTGRRAKRQWCSRPQRTALVV